MSHEGWLMSKPRRLHVAASGCLLALVALGPSEVAGRTLESIQSRGTIALCAHANALPFASRKDSPPGFQIEIARALARELGVGLEIAWVTILYQRSAVNCDIVLDAIVDRQVQEDSPVKVSKPYLRSGVGLALPAGAESTKTFGDFQKGKRVGVQVGSLAQMVLSQRGLQTTPFGFEDEMIEAVAAGTLDGAAVVLECRRRNARIGCRLAAKDRRRDREAARRRDNPRHLHALRRRAPRASSLALALPTTGDDYQWRLPSGSDDDAKRLHVGTLRHDLPADILDHDAKLTGPGLFLDRTGYQVAGEFKRERRRSRGFVIGALVRCYQQAGSPEGGSLGAADLDGELATNGGVAAGQQSD